MKLLSFLTTSAALLSTTAAHGGVLWYKFGNSWYKGFAPYNDPSTQTATIQRQWATYNPLLDPTAATLACNTPGTASSQTVSLAAGSTITAYWNSPWPHTIGPVVVWMASCGGSCATNSPAGNAWFKIDQAGLISGTLVSGTWGAGQMVAANSSWTSTIPKTLAPGNYLLRHETIALHTSNQPQWYPECAQVQITGTGTATPGSAYLASIPGVYSMSDPNINIDIYSNENSQKTTWTMPGPAVWTG